MLNIKQGGHTEILILKYSNFTRRDAKVKLSINLSLPVQNNVTIVIVTEEKLFKVLIQPVPLRGVKCIAKQ